MMSAISGNLTAADVIFIFCFYFCFLYLTEKIRHGISCELAASR